LKEQTKYFHMYFFLRLRWRHRKSIDTNSWHKPPKNWHPKVPIFLSTKRWRISDSLEDFNNSVALSVGKLSKPL